MHSHLSWSLDERLVIGADTKWPLWGGVLQQHNIAQLLLERTDERNFFRQRRVCKSWWIASEYVVTQWYLWLKRRMKPVRILKTVSLMDQVLRFAVRRERQRLERQRSKCATWIKEYESALFEERARLVNLEMRLVDACRWYSDLLAKPRKRIRVNE